MTNVRLHEPMKKHTTFRIGGPADYYLCPHSTEEEMQKILQICRENNIEFFILENGSNLLVSDKGYRGAVIQLWKNFSDITVENHTITVKAGALLSKVAAEALEEGSNRYGICFRNSGNYWRSCCDERRGLRRRDEGYY